MRIESPQRLQILTREASVDIRGTVSAERAVYYRVYVGRGTSPAKWDTMASLNRCGELRAVLVHVVVRMSTSARSTTREHDTNTIHDQARAVIEKILAHLGLPLDPPRPDPARSPEWLTGLSADSCAAGGVDWPG